jgi:cytidine deaminase
VQAVAAGAAGRGADPGMTIRRILFTTSNPAISTPCGACCQFIFELAREARLLYGREGRIVKAWNNVSDLLPEAVDATWRTGKP